MERVSQQALTDDFCAFGVMLCSARAHGAEGVVLSKAQQHLAFVGIRSAPVPQGVPDQVRLVELVGRRGVVLFSPALLGGCVAAVEACRALRWAAPRNPAHRSGQAGCLACWNVFRARVQPGRVIWQTGSQRDIASSLACAAGFLPSFLQRAREPVQARSPHAADLPRIKEVGLRSNQARDLLDFILRR